MVRDKWIKCNNVIGVIYEILVIINTYLIISKYKEAYLWKICFFRLFL